MFVIPMLLTPWHADDRSRAFAQDVSAAIDATLTRKEAAALLQIKEPLLSEWLACARPMNAFRLTALPETFWHALMVRLAERRGGYYFTPEIVTLLRGAAALKRNVLAARMRLPRERKTA
jgi:hypothetical protein